MEATTAKTRESRRKRRRYFIGVLEVPGILVSFKRGPRLAIDNIRRSEEDKPGDLLELRIVEPVPGVVLRMIVGMLARVEEDDGHTFSRKYVSVAACEPFPLYLQSRF